MAEKSLIVSVQSEHAGPSWRSICIHVYLNSVIIKIKKQVENIFEYVFMIMNLMMV